MHIESCQTLQFRLRSEHGRRIVREMFLHPGDGGLQTGPIAGGIALQSGQPCNASLEMPMNAILVSKADDPRREAYSAFQVDRLDLASFLRHRKVERVFVTGLATDYCVRQTALDARAAGFTVYWWKTPSWGRSGDHRHGSGGHGGGGYRPGEVGPTGGLGRTPAHRHDEDGDLVERG